MRFRLSGFERNPNRHAVSASGGRLILPACLGLVVLACSISLVSSWGAGRTLDHLILSRMGMGEILRYLDASDRQRGLTEEQIAVKYILGEIPENIEPPGRVVLMWASLPPSEKRSLKLNWFREHYKSLNAEEVNKHVNIEYLKTRATAEFRASPLYGAPLAKEEKKPAAAVKPQPKKKPKTAAQPRKHLPKPSKKIGEQISQGAAPGAVAVAKSDRPKTAQKLDTGGIPGTPGSVLRKLPSSGIPTRMKNE
ncbi:hypothetical protein HY522_02285 [bacterium]|nr:hypothetical protein [bacterium]